MFSGEVKVHLRLVLGYLSLMYNEMNINFIWCSQFEYVLSLSINYLYMNSVHKIT